MTFLETLSTLGSRPILVASHRRSGTHLAIDLMRRQFRECRGWKLPGERSDRLYVNLDRVLDPQDAATSPSMGKKVARRSERAVMKTHRLPAPSDGVYEAFTADELELLDGIVDIVYVFRDGREVLTSFHQYRRGFDPAAQCSLGEFIRQEEHGVSRARFWAEHVRAWHAIPDVTLLRYDQVVRDSAATVERLGSRLEMTPIHRQPLLPARLSGPVAVRTARLVRVRPESSAILATGPKEHWRTGFSAADRRFFEDETDGLLTTLGLEPSDAWVEGTT